MSATIEKQVTRIIHGKSCPTLVNLIWILPVPIYAIHISSTILCWFILEAIYKLVPLTRRLYDAVIDVGKWIARRYMRHEQFYEILGVYTILIWLVPAMFFHKFYNVMKDDTQWSYLHVYLYHVIRLGPYFSSYAYIWAGVHEEAHILGQRRSFWQKGTIPRRFQGGIEWFIGMFYGCVPAVFSISHNKIHHVDPHHASLDWNSNHGYQRDSVWSFLDYMWRMLLFMMGINGLYVFGNVDNRRQPGLFNIQMKGFVYYWTITLVLLIVHPKFALWYWIYPFLEAHFLTSAISYTWHAFVEPNDVENEYVASVTILKGHYNIFNADYHVFHHQQPAANFWEAPKKFEKDKEIYRENMATMFQDTQLFELFFMIIFRDHAALADRFVDLNGKMTKSEKIELLKRRLEPIPDNTTIAKAKAR